MGVNEKVYLRMTLNERIQHSLLASSFIVLVITGFMLKFPESFWVKWIAFVVGEGTFEARGIIHRVASVVMVGISFYHLYYLLFTTRGKQLAKDFWLRKKDLFDMLRQLGYLTGKNKEHVKFGRFSYIEKMEYWAVAWGTVVMGITGGVLWFENTFLKIINTSGMDIATTIHYYEAILASLALLVWHFYFVFFNPDVFPMSKAWYKGFLTREEMEKEHPLELEEIDKAEKGKESAVTKETLTEPEEKVPSEIDEALNKPADEVNSLKEEISENNNTQDKEPKS